MRITHNVLIAILLAFAAVLLLFRLDQPNVYIFDESHYVPAAKLYLEGQSETNYEHPPLGKELIAAGIWIFGDNPWGWRVLSAIFGLLTLLMVHSLALSLLKSSSAALFVVALLVFNQFWFVQSRMGTLDVFMVFFLFAGFQKAVQILLKSQWQIKDILVAGFSFGFAMACKWFGVLPFGAVLACVAILSYRRNNYWPLAGLVGTATVAYALTCVPFLLIEQPGHTLSGLLQLHVAAIDWQSHGERVLHHFSHSEWYVWPFATKGMVMHYVVDKASVQFREMILLLLNPVQAFLGLLALGVCAFCAWKSKDPRAGLILLIFASLYLPWSFIPHFNTYYYYYYPASVVLALALGFVLVQLSGARRVWFARVTLALSVLSFALLYPLMTAVDLLDLPFWRGLLDQIVYVP